jgi:hypothetical protein
MGEKRNPPEPLADGQGGSEEKSNRPQFSTFAPPKSTGNFLDAALGWLALGIGAIPIVPGGKSPAVKWRRFTKELPTRDDVMRWWADGRRFNLAVICGWAGLVAFDFDDVAHYREWRFDHPGPARTYTVKTSQGFHAYFTTDDPKSFDLPGIEVRGSGRYVVAPPSVHPSGVVYQAVDPRAKILRVNLPAILPSVARSTQLPSKTPVNQGASLKQIILAWDILELARTLTELKSSDGGRGRWWLGLCPFHDDHSPSFWLDAERQRFGCYSPRCVAHRSGDVVNLFALAHRVTVQEAIQMMRGQR